MKISELVVMIFIRFINPYRYTATKDNIDEILLRALLNPGESGYTPSKRPQLSDSRITVFEKQEEDGFIQIKIQLVSKIKELLKNCSSFIYALSY